MTWKHSANIRRNVDGISDEIRKAQKKLDLLGSFDSVVLSLPSSSVGA